MKKILQTQQGSAIVLSLISMVFLAIVVSGIIPFVNSQLSNSTKNIDTLQVQYVAEAGAKRAIIGIKNNRTDWAWTGGPHNTFLNEESKYYTTEINPPIPDTKLPQPGQTYTIKSIGHIGNIKKTVTLEVTTASEPKINNIFAYAVFSQNNMVINQPQINGDVYSNGHITVNSHTNNTVTGAAYCAKNNYTIYNPPAIGKGFQVPDKQVTLTVDNLMIPMPPIPSMQSMDDLSTKETDIRKTWTKGEWSNETYPLKNSFYSYEGTYGMYNHSYSIDPGQSVTIYVKGDFNIGKNITGGNITIYATGNVTLNEKSIVQASPGGTVTIYANKILTLNSGSAIIGNTVTAYAMGDINLNAGTIQASPSGTVRIYTNNTLALNSGSAIIGNTVTALANNSAKSYAAISFNSGSINKNLAGSISKLYAKGLVALNDTSVIAGNGTGMLVATGNINLNGGTAENTIFISNGTIDGNSGSRVAGLYANNMLNMNGASVLYNANVIKTLGLGSGSEVTPFTILQWNKEQ